MLKRITILTLFLAILLVMPKLSNAQIIRPTGDATEASSQLIFVYGDDQAQVQVTNTNDTLGVWIHVQIFRNDDPDDIDNNGDEIICDERDFVDFLTPNDTHIYEFDEDNFPKNMGETELVAGDPSTITDTDDTQGFVLITPVVSESDFTAISFQHLIGHRAENLTRLNAMGRDAVDFATGDIVSDNTPLDGTSNGFVVLQPDELFFDIVADGGSSDHEVVGISFIDGYGPNGLLGYTATPGDVTWTSFLFDFRENPTSCGNFQLGCYINIGINETQFDQEDGSFLDGLLCSGTTIPDDPGSYGDPVGWVRAFVSGLDDFENHLGYLENEDLETSRWMYTNRDDNEISTVQAPTGTVSRATSQLIYYYDTTDEASVAGGTDGDNFIQVTNTSDTDEVWVHVQIFRSFDAGDDTPDSDGDEIICDERNFVDLLTPNDTHVYDLAVANFTVNMGETELTPGNNTSIDADDTKGFVIITPVVSGTDFTAISFQHLVGSTREDTGDIEFGINAMGRDAVDFTTGAIVADGTPLDGTTNGFVVLQPEELLFDFGADLDDGPGGEADVIGIVFQDTYGPAGLLGYNIIPGEVNWTSFLFDFNEDPTSCGTRTIGCFSTIGINDTFTQANQELTQGDTLCTGIETPPHPTLEPFGWARIFVSGLGELENHIGVFAQDFDSKEGADYMYVRGERVGGGDPVENCAVAGDEEGDMLADCADTDCDGQLGPNGETCEAVEATCDDGADNDGDGATDGADTDCDGSESCPTCESGDQCSDGEDNDGDGNSDCADGGCDGETGPNGETCEAGVELTCNDGEDNDGDGTSDCDDPDCAIATNCIAGDGGGGGGGCSVASTANPSMLNFLLPLIVVGLVIGIRRKR